MYITQSKEKSIKLRSRYKGHFKFQTQKTVPRWEVEVSKAYTEVSAGKQGIWILGQICVQMWACVHMCVCMRLTGCTSRGIENWLTCSLGGPGWEWRR